MVWKGFSQFKKSIASCGLSEKAEAGSLTYLKRDFHVAVDQNCV